MDGIVTEPQTLSVTMWAGNKWNSFKQYFLETWKGNLKYLQILSVEINNAYVAFIFRFNRSSAHAAFFRDIQLDFLRLISIQSNIDKLLECESDGKMRMEFVFLGRQHK